MDSMIKCVRSAADVLTEKIISRDAVIGIVGLGYVGLPLMLAMTNQRFRVIGFDVDDKRVRELNEGKSPLKHISDNKISSAILTNRFEATTDHSRLSEPDAVVVCVPTPLAIHREPDLSILIRATEAISRALRPGQLIVLESTTYPGTTHELVSPILERNGLVSGIDFLVGYSPEREDPGNQEYSTPTIPKIVGGEGEDALKVTIELYSAFVNKVVPVSSTGAAEAVKITENVFRAVNIALANELKIIYAKMGIDIFEVIDAAKTKPFGFMPFYPGPGLGGHCIPIDPLYLTWKARERGINTKLIEVADEINSAMPNYVVARVREAIDKRNGIGLSRACILVVGIAYKKNVDDVRESPALRIIEELIAQGASVEYYDPLVPTISDARGHPELRGKKSIILDTETIARFDAVLIVTDHDAIDWQLLLEHCRLIVDTRNIIRKIGMRGYESKIISA
jgi:UDP-N-acetyl-D-glucosamine dehydrogenase